MIISDRLITSIRSDLSENMLIFYTLWVISGFPFVKVPRDNDTIYDVELNWIFRARVKHQEAETGSIQVWSSRPGGRDQPRSVPGSTPYVQLLALRRFSQFVILHRQQSRDARSAGPGPAPSVPLVMSAVCVLHRDTPWSHLPQERAERALNDQSRKLSLAHTHLGRPAAPSGSGKQQEGEKESD